MKRAMMIVFAVALAAGVLLAQTPQQAPTTTQEPPASTMPQASTPSQSPTPAQTGATTGSASPEQKAAHIAPGSIIPARLTKTVDAKKAKQGDQVVATVPGDLKATNGEVLVPKDTKVIGHITEAQKRSKEQKESQLGIAFDQMQMQNGQEVQLPMSIQAIVAPANRNNNASPENQPSTAPSGTSTMSPPGGSRAGTMGGNSSAPTGAPSTESAPANTQAQSSPTPPITENTKGMVGFKDMNLEAPNANNASVVTSEKNNVKLEDGTLMLLRVSPSAQQNQQSPQTQQTPQQK